MDEWSERLVMIICAVFASSGLWAFLENRFGKKNAKSRMILGLGHDRLMFLCEKYIDRGWITDDEYEDLDKYLYQPYKAMGGNGTVERLINEIKLLPIRHIDYKSRKKRGWFRRQRPTR